MTLLSLPSLPPVLEGALPGFSGREHDGGELVAHYVLLTIGCTYLGWRVCSAKYANHNPQKGCFQISLPGKMTVLMTTEGMTSRIIPFSSEMDFHAVQYDR